jgi:hypothetical protein
LEAKASCMSTMIRAIRAGSRPTGFGCAFKMTPGELPIPARMRERHCGGRSRHIAPTITGHPSPNHIVVPRKGKKHCVLSRDSIAVGV